MPAAHSDGGATATSGHIPRLDGRLSIEARRYFEPNRSRTQGVCGRLHTVRANRKQWGLIGNIVEVQSRRPAVVYDTGGNIKNVITLLKVSWIRDCASGAVSSPRIWIDVRCDRPIEPLGLASVPLIIRTRKAGRLLGQRKYVFDICIRDKFWRILYRISDVLLSARRGACNVGIGIRGRNADREPVYRQRS